VSAVNSVNSTEIDAAQVNRVAACSFNCSSAACLSSAEVRETTPSVECMRPIETDVVYNTIGDDESREFPFAVCPVVDKINLVRNCSVNVRLSPLQYTDVFVDGIRCRALKDSGAQLSLISQAVCDQLKAEVYGHILLQGVVGDLIRAPLVNVCIKPCSEPDSVNIAEGIQVLCGVAPLASVSHDVILTSEVIDDLSQLPVASMCNVIVSADVMNVNEDDCEGEMNDECDISVDDDDESKSVYNVDDVNDIDVNVECGSCDASADDEDVVSQCVHNFDIVLSECMNDDDGSIAEQTDPAGLTSCGKECNKCCRTHIVYIYGVNNEGSMRYPSGPGPQRQYAISGGRQPQ